MNEVIANGTCNIAMSDVTYEEQPASWQGVAPEVRRREVVHAWNAAVEQRKQAKRDRKQFRAVFDKEMNERRAEVQCMLAETCHVLGSDYKYVVTDGIAQGAAS